MLSIAINNINIDNPIQVDLIDSISEIKSAAIYLKNIDGIKIFDNCTIIYNGKLFLTGYIKNIIPVLNAENHYYILQIKSATGILIDSVVLQNLEFTNSSLKEIIERITAIYNIKTIFKETEITNYKINNEIDNSASARINESCWSFITRLCNSRGLLVKDTGANKIEIIRLEQNKANIKPKHSVIFGESTIINWLPIYNYDNLARYYEIYSQFNTNSKELITFEAIKLPITKRIINNEINSGLLKSYGIWIICREIEKAVKLQIEINGSQEELEVGNLISAENNQIGLEQPTDMIIEKIITNYPNKTTIILTLPCAYTGILPGKLPFL